MQRPCSSQLPPERPAAAKTCRQTALQQPTAARETCNSKDPAPLPTFRKTSSAPHRVHLVAVPVHPVPPSQQIRSSRHRPPRTLSSLLDLPILTSPDPANHLDLPILTSPHPANHLFDLQPIGRPPSLFSPSPNLPSSPSTPPFSPPITTTSTPTTTTSSIQTTAPPTNRNDQWRGFPIPATSITGAAV